MCGLNPNGSDNRVSPVVCFFQAEDGIRDLVRSRGLGDVYKRQDEARSGRRNTANARAGDDDFAAGLRRTFLDLTARVGALGISGGRCAQQG